MPETEWASAQHRAVGAQLLDGSQPVYAVASALGGDRGNVKRLLRRMADLDLVCEERPDADGQPRWALAPDQREPLVAAVAADQPVGRLVDGQVLLVAAVPADRQAGFTAALRTSALTAPVVWAARVEGADGQWLLAVDRNASPLASETIVAALAARGVVCTRLVVEDVMSGEALRRHAAALRHTART